MPVKRLDPVGYAAAISTNGQTWHGVRMEARPKPDVTLAHRINPLWWPKNSDEPMPPASYRPHGKHRKLTWFFRNFGHNFGFYAVGVADKTTVRKGYYPPLNSKPGGGLNFQITEWSCLRFTFISWKTSWFFFYAGWRERGNFGLELHIGDQHLEREKKIEKDRGAPVYAPYPLTSP